MKKYSGKVICSGILTMIFGLIVMVGVNLVSGKILGPTQKSSEELVRNMLSTSIDTSWFLIIIGVLALVVGLFMHSSGD